MRPGFNLAVFLVDVCQCSDPVDILLALENVNLLLRLDLIIICEHKLGLILWQTIEALRRLDLRNTSEYSLPVRSALHLFFIHSHSFLLKLIEFFELSFSFLEH